MGPGHGWHGFAHLFTLRITVISVFAREPVIVFVIASDCVIKAGRMRVPGGVLWVIVLYACYRPMGFRVILVPLIMGDELSH